MKKVLERTINYYETDKMGVVHHSNYVRFLEEARIDFFEKVNLGYAGLEALGIISPVLGVSCEYKHPVGFNDTILIETSIKSYNGLRYTIEYVITNKKTGDLVVKAETKHCFTDNNLKPLSLKKHFPEIDEKINNLIAN